MENKLVIGILDIVEDKLREFGVQLPDEMREDSKDPIVGFHYAELHDRIKEYLEEVGVLEKDGVSAESPASRVTRKAITEFERTILNQLEEVRDDLWDYDLDVLQFIDAEHQNCIWYGGPVATVEHKGYVCSLEACGDVAVSVMTPDCSDVMCRYYNKDNRGAYWDQDAREHLVNDRHLDELYEEGRLVFGLNNWFEVFIEDPQGVRSQITEVCSSDNLEECIIEMVETMDLIIADVEQSKRPIAERIAEATSKSIKTESGGAAKVGVKNDIEV